MGERRGTKALETWCRRVTQGYPGVKVENMTTSWRDGLAFCALIHHFRPDLIDFARLDKSDVYGNNELAFRIAERHLGIPALLDAEDMAEYPVPDRLSILTYLSQFYQAFASNSSSPIKKASSDSPDASLVSLVQGNVQPPPKMEWSARGREPCAVCKLPVFIAQRLRVEGRLYHRTCFRCARCGAQLNPADCYETCGGEFVCETCPDEMAAPEESTEPLPVIPMGSPIPTSPVVPPPPTMPPEPPPSIVAMRRLMFDTDDAKLMKHDHSVNTTRIAHSIKKDLSKNANSRSVIDKDEANTVNIDVDMSKDLSTNPHADSSPKNSIKLDECVNSSTISAISVLPENARDSNINETSYCPSKEVDNSVNLGDNSSLKEPLDISQDTFSYNDNYNTSEVDKVASHSDSDEIIQPSRDEKLDIEKEEMSEKVAVETLNITKVTPSDNVEEDSVSPVAIEDHSITKEKGNVERTKSIEYPTDLNPFGDSDEDESSKPMPAAPKVSTNPFGSDSEEEEPIPLKPPPRATPRKMSLSMRSTASTNPFDSDEDDIESTPIPLPRQSEQSSPEPTPFPRRSKLRTSARSITSLSSIGSYSSTSPRKKRPAPPPPTHATLSPSSRYSSVSSLNRPRKTKRAPLPPSTAQAHSSSPLKTSDASADSLLLSEANYSIPQIEVTVSSETGEANSKTTGELVAQIEKGLQKLMAQDDSLKIDPPTQITTARVESPPSLEYPGDPKISQLEEKESPLSDSSKDEKHMINESSKSEEVTDDKDVSICAIKKESSICENVDQEFPVDKKNQNNRPVTSEKEIDVLSEIVNKEEYIDDKEIIADKECIADFSCDKLIKNSEDTTSTKSLKTVEVVETFNEVLLSDSRNKSTIQFEEIELPAHSTPVKIIPSLALLDSSLEDITPGTPDLSSPPASCADTSSYQESLSSPPTEKKIKDSANMHRKISESGVYQPHKSMYGQWKRKKGPAPPLPIPQRRSIKPMAMQRIRQELSDIEIKQQELERQGVSLEEKIREKFDSGTSITPYLEDLVLQLFELVNEKNELFRKQAELMYIRRQHQLEEEHAELEYQIRCLMSRPEANKTDSDKELEEKLIQRLVEVVERRDAIVQCLEMDRLREVEEDKSINCQLDRFTRAIVTDDRMKVKKKYKKKKEKHNTLKMLDLDKDFDEAERESKKKKKWYTLHHKMTKHL